MTKTHKKDSLLPRRLQPLFWDYEFAKLSWKADADLIIGRVLAVGDWEALRCLLRRVTKPALRDWLQHRQGAGLSARQLRFWEIIVEIPRREVNSWLANPARQVWEGRRHA